MCSDAPMVTHTGRPLVNITVSKRVGRERDLVLSHGHYYLPRSYSEPRHQDCGWNSQPTSVTPRYERSEPTGDLHESFQSFVCKGKDVSPWMTVERLTVERALRPQKRHPDTARNFGLACDWFMSLARNVEQSSTADSYGTRQLPECNRQRWLIRA